MPNGKTGQVVSLLFVACVVRKYAGWDVYIGGCEEAGERWNRNPRRACCKMLSARRETRATLTNTFELDFAFGFSYVQGCLL